MLEHVATKLAKNKNTNCHLNNEIALNVTRITCNLYLINPRIIPTHDKESNYFIRLFLVTLNTIS